MSIIRRHLKLIAVAASSALIGASAGVIANAGAASATTKPAAAARSSHALVQPALRRALLHSVHGDLVVATKAGFVSVTFDRGTVQSVSGQQLTMTDATKKQTYQTVTLTIPAGAKVRNNRVTSTLGDLQQGERVLVVQTPARTWVIARTPHAS